MTLNKALAIALVVQIAILSTLVISPAQTSTQPASATQQSDKYDGDCTGHETAGRCADKCPPPSFVRGFDKETGAAICGTVTGCPYGDSIPLGPECDKHIPQENLTPAPAEVSDFVGK